MVFLSPCACLFIHERDSEIGTEKYTELCTAVEDSRKLIILLSNSYLASAACLNEANLLAIKLKLYQYRYLCNTSLPGQAILTILGK